MKIERRYWPAWVLIIAMFFAWVSWGMVYNQTSPFASPVVAIPLFYVSGFFSITFTVATFSVLLRIAFLPKTTIAEHINSALRQGIIFGAMIIIILLFQQYRILTWWIGGMIVAICLLIEALFWEQDEQTGA